MQKLRFFSLLLLLTGKLHASTVLFLGTFNAPNDNAVLATYSLIVQPNNLFFGVNFRATDAPQPRFAATLGVNLSISSLAGDLGGFSSLGWEDDCGFNRLESPKAYYVEPDTEMSLIPYFGARTSGNTVIGGCGMLAQVIYNQTDRLMPTPGQYAELLQGGFTVVYQYGNTRLTATATNRIESVPIPEPRYLALAPLFGLSIFRRSRFA